MIIRKQPLVKLVELADQAYFDQPLTNGPGRPYVYSQRLMFKCFVIKTVKRFADCSALFNFLTNVANQHIAHSVGLADVMPCLKTFQRRFEERLRSFNASSIARSSKSAGGAGPNQLRNAGSGR